MPPKRTFSKDKIVDAALKLMRREGASKLTARAIAKELGSSTMPVYSTIESMEKLKELIFQRSTEIAAGFRTKYSAGDVLTNYALGHIMLAKEEKMLFRLVWMDDSWDRSVIAQMLKNNVSAIRKELQDEGKYKISADDQTFIEFISKAWLLIRGIAVDVNLGSFQLIADDGKFVDSMTCFVSQMFDDFLANQRIDKK